MHGRRKRDPKIGGRKVPGFRFRSYDSLQVDDIIMMLLCVLRSNSSIEIWDVSHKPHVDRTLICDGSVEGLGWYNSRLFSCSANGTVTEHDLHSLSPLVSYG